MDPLPRATALLPDVTLDALARESCHGYSLCDLFKGPSPLTTLPTFPPVQWLPTISNVSKLQLCQEEPDCSHAFLSVLCPGVTASLEITRGSNS